MIKNIVAHPVENVLTKTNTLVKDGLNLPGVKVISAERKLSRNDHPGIVIVKCASPEHVQQIMDNKAKLKDNTRYRNVYISRDIPLAQRILNSNMRTIIDTIGRDKLEMRGSMVTRRNSARGGSAPNTSHSSNGRDNRTGTQNGNRGDSSNQNGNSSGVRGDTSGRVSRGGRGGRGGRGARR